MGFVDLRDSHLTWDPEFVEYMHLLVTAAVHFEHQVCSTVAHRNAENARCQACG